MPNHFDREGFLFSLGFIILIIFSVFTARLYGDFLGTAFFSPEIYFAKGAANVQEAVPQEKIIKLAFVGDIMLDRGVEQKILKEGSGDFAFPFLLIAQDLNIYDFLFGNLEGALSDKGKNVGSIFSFRMDPEAVKGLKFAGFDALSVANNHSGDWGREAFEDTVARLGEAEIFPVGESDAPKILEIGDFKMALVAFSDFPGPGLRAEEDIIKNTVEKARGQTDFVIASFHFGEEYQKEPSARQREMAELAVRSGASLVVGHHPHVSQPVEKYENAYIAYSLGNFVFDQYFSDETMRSVLLEVEIKDKKIVGVSERRFHLNENYQPIFD